jgi:hypothetical protein
MVKVSDIYQMTYAALTGLGVPLSASQHLPATADGGLPDLYITYMMVDLTPAQHADNKEISRDELVQVSIRSRSGLSGLPDVIGAMISVGFMFAGGRELDFDSESAHYGIAFDFEYLRDLGA